MEKKPEERRTWPEPPQEGQRRRPWPCAAPLPLHGSQVSLREKEISRLAPKTASSKEISRS